MMNRKVGVGVTCRVEPPGTRSLISSASRPTSPIPGSAPELVVLGTPPDHAVLTTVPNFIAAVRAVLGSAPELSHVGRREGGWSPG